MWRHRHWARLFGVACERKTKEIPMTEGEAASRVQGALGVLRLGFTVL